MATAPEFEGTQEEWDEAMRRQNKMLSDHDDLIRAIRHRNYLGDDFAGKGGKKSRRHGKKSRRHAKKSRRHGKKSRRHGKKCRR